MIKRLIWLTTGIAVGLGSSLWLVRRVRETVSRYAPERVADDLVRTARTLRADLRSALAEGRAAMRATEADLRAELAGGPARPGGHRPPDRH